jgi:hypothetical protein
MLALQFDRTQKNIIKKIKIKAEWLGWACSWHGGDGK